MTTATRARAASISSRRAPARSLASASSAVRTRLSAAATRSLRHVPPRRRIVSLLARAGVGLEQRLEALEVLFGGVELGSRGGRRRRGRWRSAIRPAGCPRRARRPGPAAAALRPRPAPPSRGRWRAATSRVSSVSTVWPGCTRSPSFTVSVRMRPPTSGARRISVASTWPDTRMRSVGASFAQPTAIARATVRERASVSSAALVSSASWRRKHPLAVSWLWAITSSWDMATNIGKSAPLRAGCAATRSRAALIMIGPRTDVVGEDGMHGPEHAARWPCVRIAAKLVKTHAHVRQRVGVETRRAFGDLAQHQRGKPRPRLGMRTKAVDEPIELRRPAVRSRSAIARDGRAHAAQACRRRRRDRARACRRSGSRSSPC